MKNLITKDSLRAMLFLLAFAVAYEAIDALPGLYRKYDTQRLLADPPAAAQPAPAEAPYSKAEVVRSVPARSHAELVERVRMHGYVGNLAIALKALLVFGGGVWLARLARRRAPGSAA